MFFQGNVAGDIVNIYFLVHKNLCLNVLLEGFHSSVKKVLFLTGRTILLTLTVQEAISVKTIEDATDTAKARNARTGASTAK